MKPLIPLLLKPALTATPPSLSLLNNVFAVNPKLLNHIRMNADNL